VNQGGSGGGNGTLSGPGGLYGGGGVGFGAFTVGSGGGGGGGGLRWSILAVTPGTAYTVIVGSGGQVVSGGDGANGAVAVWYMT
jgi:hypothetical protein